MCSEDELMWAVDVYFSGAVVMFNPRTSHSPRNRRRIARARRAWLSLNPPDEDGNYMCTLCNKPVAADKVSLDHIKERALIKHDSEYFDLSNLQPSHIKCNMKRARVFVKEHHEELKARSILFNYKREIMRIMSFILLNSFADRETYA